jgi:hypothetical protein
MRWPVLASSSWSIGPLAKNKQLHCGRTVISPTRLNKVDDTVQDVREKSSEGRSGIKKNENKNKNEKRTKLKCLWKD